MLHLPIHPIFHISKYLFYPVDGIIHLFSCICNLALHHIICHQPVQKEMYGGGAGSFLLNIIWLIVSGLPLALEHLALGTALCVTIIGIPFGLQQFKLAKLALMPFGAEVY